MIVPNRGGAERWETRVLTSAGFPSRGLKSAPLPCEQRGKTRAGFSFCSGKGARVPPQPPPRLPGARTAAGAARRTGGTGRHHRPLCRRSRLRAGTRRSAPAAGGLLRPVLGAIGFRDDYYELLLSLPAAFLSLVGPGCVRLSVPLPPGLSIRPGATRRGGWLSPGGGAGG